MQPRSKIEYDARRPTARERGYTRRWERVSKAFLKQHPLCLGCHAIGRTVPAELTDHAIPHKGDEALFWDETNWQPCCRWHHDVVKQKLELQVAAGKLDLTALRLDSPEAIRLTRRDGVITGADGWPV